MPYRPLSDYGLIGNSSSTALVSKTGSIDWACLPYLDSPSHFGALLDEFSGGKFQISPHGEFFSEQRYFQRSNVLETVFETPTGRGVVTDWMPTATEGGEPTDPPVIQRRIDRVDGLIRWTLHCAPRFRYGSETVQAEFSRGGILFRGAQSDSLALLLSQVPLEISKDGVAAVAEFEIPPGESRQFCWAWGRQRPFNPFLPPKPTLELWQRWAHSCPTTEPCVFAGPWHDNVTRSGLALKLLTAGYSGAMAEAPTTSLPSIAGGSRNWDYRFAWIRDSAFAVQALSAMGHEAEASAFFEWLASIVCRDGAEALQPVYTLDGGRFLPEREIPSLSGYGGSRPVRHGNQSARHFQLDTFGHVMLAAAYHFRLHSRLPTGLWDRLAEIADYVCQAWRRPDQGPWEVRGKAEHFVGSKVLCWAALDRACWLAQAHGLAVPQRWKDERSILHRTICDQGFDSRKQSFVRAFGSSDLDAGALLIPLFGFLPFSDPRVQNTMLAIRQNLSDGVLIHRYQPEQGYPEAEGANIVSSSWFISCLALNGQVDEASDRLAELCTFATPLGLFGEMVSPATGEPWGNFPSASGLLGLVNAGLYVGVARGRRSSLRFHLPHGLPEELSEAAPAEGERRGRRLKAR